MYGRTDGLRNLIARAAEAPETMRGARGSLDRTPTGGHGVALRVLGTRMQGLAGGLLSAATRQDDMVTGMRVHHRSCVDKRAEIERARQTVLARQETARTFRGSVRTVDKLIPVAENRPHYTASPRAQSEQTPGSIWVRARQIATRSTANRFTSLNDTNGTDVLPEQEERARVIQLLNTPTNREDREWITLSQDMPKQNW